MPNNNQPTLSAEQMAEVRAASEEWQRDLETEALIVGKNQHSVYRYCACSGFGINMPMEDICPNCGEHGILYLSGEDVRQILNAAPALLALADEAVRLREMMRGLRVYAAEIEHDAITSLQSLRASLIQEIVDRALGDYPSAAE